MKKLGTFNFPASLADPVYGINFYSLKKKLYLVQFIIITVGSTGSRQCTVYGSLISRNVLITLL